MQHFKGKLMIKGIGPGGSSQKLAIPWIAEVLQGGLQVNVSAAHYCSPHSSQPRNFSVVNKFKRPLAITDVSLSSEAMPLFKVSQTALWLWYKILHILWIADDADFRTVKQGWFFSFIQGVPDSNDGLIWLCKKMENSFTRN